MKTELIATLALELLTQAVKLMQRHNAAVAAGLAEVPDAEIRSDLDAAIAKLDSLNSDGMNAAIQST